MADTINPILTTAEGIAVGNFLPVLNGFFTSIKANPSIENCDAQALLIQPQLIAALPNLQQCEISYLAGALKDLMDKYAAAHLPAVPTPAA